MKRTSRFVAALLLATICSLAIPAGVRAAEPAKEPAALSITPAIQDRVMAPTEKQTTFTVSIANNTNAPLKVAISTADFTALNQYGGVAFLGEDANRSFKGHGLSGILKPDIATITLAPNSSKEVSVTAREIPKLAPGGHYGAIIAKVVDPNTGDGKNQLATKQAVSSLVFLETAGQGTKTMNLISLPSQGLSFGLPSEVNLVFKATGNTQAIPRGVVTVSRGDTEVMRGIVNPDSSLILPGSTRLLQTPLKGDTHPWPMGMYTLKVQYKYDGSLGITTYEQKFLYINVLSVVLLFVITVGVLYIAVWGRRFWKPWLIRLGGLLRKYLKLQYVVAFARHIAKAIEADIKKLQKEKYEPLPPPARSGARKKKVDPPKH